MKLENMIMYRMKKRLCIIFCIAFCSISINLFAQTGSLRTGFQSPTAASLGKFGDLPVSFYTGMAKIDIPLYQLEGANLSLPIQLRYHASGIKVQEIPSWVGAGWALDAGGVITRSIRGLPDTDFHGGYYFEGGDSLYNDQKNNWTDPDYEFVRQIEHGELDTEPDQFFFNFAGYSGKFVLGPKGEYSPSGDPSTAIRTLPHQKLKIKPEFGPQTVDKWTIITENGTQYIFTRKEKVTETLSVSGLYSPETEPYHYSSWFLTKIISPSGNDEINLTYESYSATHEMKVYQEVFNFGTDNSGNSCSPDDKEIEGTYTIDSYRLASIQTASQTAYFDASIRADNEYQLDSIRVVSNSGGTLKKIKFTYSTRNNRSFLESVQELSTKSNTPDRKPYEFVYNDTGLPARSSTSIDHWGYYNGAPNGDYLIPEYFYPASDGRLIYLDGADRDPNASVMQAGILEQIIYPTGGRTEFEYESHDYANVSGFEPKETVTRQQNSSLTAIYEEDNTYLKRKNVIIGGETDAKVQVHVNFNPEDCGQWSECYVYFDGNYYTEPGTYDEIASPGTLELRAKAPPKFDDSNTPYFSYIRVAWEEEYSVNNLPDVPGITAGGLRIKEIRDYDGTGNVQTKRYKYRRYSEGLEGKSSGVLVREPAYTYESSGTPCTYLSRSSVTRLPLGITQGSAIGYSEVTVLHGPDDNQGNPEGGKTVYFYRTAEQSPEYAYGNNEWPFAPRTSREWERGQLVQVDEYNSVGKLLRRTQNDYEFIKTDPLTSRRYRALSYKVLNSTGNYYQGYFSPYEVISGWRFLKSKTITVYDKITQNMSTNSTQFFYEDPTHLQPTKKTETNSDGQVRKTIYEYAHEDEYPGMESEHMLSQPYKVTTKDGSGNTLKVDWTLWDLYNGAWQPCAQWTGGPELGTANPPDC